MCCLLFILVLIGPRAAIIFWWLFDPSRFSWTFNTIFWPLLGILLLPWTTLMYLIIYPYNLEGFQFWGLMGLGVLIDIVAYSGGGWGNRKRFFNHD